MSLVNFTTREITCKIVYYGPGRSGKTTNLHYIYARVPDSPRAHGLARHTDRPHAVLRLPADRPRSDLRVQHPVPALHRAGPGVLQRHAPPRAPGRRRRGVRGRQPGAPARREPGEPAEPP